MKRLQFLLIAAAALYVAFVVVENLTTGEPFDWLNFGFDMFETALLASAVILTSFVSVQTSELKRERRDLLADLDEARREGNRWRTAARAHVDGLSRAMRNQFLAWQLTPAEEDVAGLLLKGLSHKEIGVLRTSSEATIRQHAASIYRKSGLSSRAQLTAFFLEDLLAPAAAAETAPPQLAVVPAKERDQGRGPL